MTIGIPQLALAMGKGPSSFVMMMLGEVVSTHKQKRLMWLFVQIPF